MRSSRPAGGLLAFPPGHMEKSLPVEPSGREDPSGEHAVERMRRRDGKRLPEATSGSDHDLAKVRLLTLNGWGHTVLGQPSACAHEAEVCYLVDLTLPAPGVVCKPDVGAFCRTARTWASQMPLEPSG